MKKFTSTRCVTALLALPNGSLQIESAGGVTLAGRGVAERRECLPPLRSVPRAALVTAQLPDGLTAIFGDEQLYLGKKPGPLLPQKLREVTALARWQGKITIGTRSQGAWILEKTGWQPLTRHDDEPLDHNIQALIHFQGTLFASTLDHGLVTLSSGRWDSLQTPTLSTNAPRQLLVHQNNLLVRHGDGQVDAFDGKIWRKNALVSTLPRRECSALAQQNRGERLIALQWGGFSLWEKTGWIHRFDLPEARSVALTCALLEGQTLFLGTQGRGLLEISGSTVRRHDERHGLPDDWITCLQKTPDGMLWAGTFVGGLARLRPDATRWETLPELRGQQVTALEPWKNTLLAATRQHVFCPNEALPAQLAQIHEAQTLLTSPSNLWIGTRTALYTF
jgi:hypothetical protein